MGKPTICIGENKDADQLISSIVFATQIVQFLFFLNPKFQASSCLLWLYSPVCVGPVRKPHCWFSHKTAQLLFEIVSCIFESPYISTKHGTRFPTNANSLINMRHAIAEPISELVIDFDVTKVIRV